MAFVLDLPALAAFTSLRTLAARLCSDSWTKIRVSIASITPDRTWLAVLRTQGALAPQRNRHIGGTVRMAGGTGNSGTARMSRTDVERGLLDVRKAKKGVLRGDGRYSIPKSIP